MDFQLKVHVSSWNEGDRISLPSLVLETIQAKWQQGRIVSSSSNMSTTVHSEYEHNDSSPWFFELTTLKEPVKTITCGVKDFSAADGTVYVPAWILSTLGLTQREAAVRVKLVTLPKATSLTLKAQDISSLSLDNPSAVLEDYLRTHFASLTQGVALPITTFQPHRFMPVTCHYYVDEIQPSSPASLINVDVEVHLIPAETDPSKLLSLQQTYQNSVKSTLPGPLPMKSPVHELLDSNSSKYYLLPIDNASSLLAVQAKLEQGDISLFLHPFVLPDINNNVAFAVMCQHGVYSLEYALDPNQCNVPGQMVLGIHSYGANQAKFQLIWSDTSFNNDGEGIGEIDMSSAEGANLQQKQCENCKNWIPEASFVLHQIRCLRDVVTCPHCQKRHRAAETHWHCKSCDFIGSLASDSSKHKALYHTSYTCPGCSASFPNAAGPEYQRHRTEACPSRRIYCDFCKTYPMAEGPASTSDRLSGLRSEHESRCGARTTECSECLKPVPLKHMSVHTRLHQKSTVAPTFTVCQNQMCGNVLDIQNGLRLCTICYRPFLQTSSTALLKKKVHRYFHQMTTGCGHSWCRNKNCKSSRCFEHQGLDAAGNALLCMDLAQNDTSWYCVPSHRLQLRRELADELSTIYLYPLGDCLEALLKFEQQIWFGTEEDEVDMGTQATEGIKQLQNRWLSMAANWLHGQKNAA